MKAPSTYELHALTRFLERWWDEDPPAETTLKYKQRKSYFETIVASGAFHVEDVPREKQSIWGFYMRFGPYQGFTGFLVVDGDGVVRTTLPPGTRKQR